MKTVLVTALVILTSACASKPDAPCQTVKCELQTIVAEIASTCRTDLYHYPRLERAYIDQKYQYPLKSYRSYQNLVNMGGRGPSPQRWCRAYAEHVAEVRLPAPGRTAIASTRIPGSAGRP